MPTRQTTYTIFKGRRTDGVVINTTIDREAHAILRRYCPPGMKGMGKFLARLLYEHEARMQDRAHLVIMRMEGEGQSA